MIALDLMKILHYKACQRPDLNVGLAVDKYSSQLLETDLVAARYRQGR